MIRRPFRSLGQQMQSFGKQRLSRYAPTQTGMTQMALPSAWQRSTREPLLWRAEAVEMPASEDALPVEPAASSEPRPTPPDLAAILALHERREAQAQASTKREPRPTPAQPPEPATPADAAADIQMAAAPRTPEAGQPSTPTRPPRPRPRRRALIEEFSGYTTPDTVPPAQPQPIPRWEQELENDIFLDEDAVAPEALPATARVDATEAHPASEPSLQRRSASTVPEAHAPAENQTPPPPAPASNALDAADAAIPEAGSAAADLLTLLDLPADTPVLGLKDNAPLQRAAKQAAAPERTGTAQQPPSSPSDTPTSARTSADPLATDSDDAPSLTDTPQPVQPPERAPASPAPDAADTAQPETALPIQTETQPAQPSERAPASPAPDAADTAQPETALPIQTETQPAQPSERAPASPAPDAADTAQPVQRIQQPASPADEMPLPEPSQPAEAPPTPDPTPATISRKSAQHPDRPASSEQAARTPPEATHHDVNAERSRAASPNENPPDIHALPLQDALRQPAQPKPERPSSTQGEPGHVDRRPESPAPQREQPTTPSEAQPAQPRSVDADRPQMHQVPLHMALGQSQPVVTRDAAPTTEKIAPLHRSQSDGSQSDGSQSDGSQSDRVHQPQTAQRDPQMTAVAAPWQDVPAAHDLRSAQDSLPTSAASLPDDPIAAQPGENFSDIPLQRVALDQALMREVAASERSGAAAAHSAGDASAAETDGDGAAQTEAGAEYDIEKLAREVYARLRDKLRIEQERYSRRK